MLGLPLMIDDLSEPWTQERFFDWAQIQDDRYEFDGVRPVMMPREINRHGAIGVNLRVALHSRLRESECTALGGNCGLETVNKTVRYPDALVTCTELESYAHVVAGVVAVFEVVSQDSNRTDRYDKFREYTAVPCIRRYVIVESSCIGVSVLERQPDDRWTVAVLTGEDILRLPDIGIEIPVAEIYEDIGFPDEEDGPA